jgi:hypothetical protein
MAAMAQKGITNQREFAPIPDLALDSAIQHLIHVSF